MRGLPVVLLVMICAPPAFAAECPAASSEAVLSALRNARSCRGAAQAYRACTRATTQDVQFAEAVVGKCESGLSLVSRRSSAPPINDRYASASGDIVARQERCTAPSRHPAG